MKTRNLINSQVFEKTSKQAKRKLFYEIQSSDCSEVSCLRLLLAVMITNTNQNQVVHNMILPPPHGLDHRPYIPNLQTGSSIHAVRRHVEFKRLTSTVQSRRLTSLVGFDLNLQVVHQLRKTSSMRSSFLDAIFLSLLPNRQNDIYRILCSELEL